MRLEGDPRNGRRRLAAVNLPRVNCPNCNSLQRFPLHERGRSGQIQVFIHCLMCREEFSIAVLSKDEKFLRKRDHLRKLRDYRQLSNDHRPRQDHYASPA